MGKIRIETKKFTITQIHGPWDSVGVLGEYVDFRGFPKNSCGKSMEDHGFKRVPGLGWTMGENKSVRTGATKIGFVDEDWNGSVMFTAPTGDFTFNMEEVTAWVKIGRQMVHD